MKKLIFAIAAAAAFTGLAVEKDDAAQHDSSVMNAGVYSSNAKVKGGVNAVFIGNSITLHGPYADIGWTNNYGMAASCVEKDYVHLMGAAIEKKTGRKVSYTIRNIADFERDFRHYDLKLLDDAAAVDADYLVIAIGENAPWLGVEADRQAYYEAFKKLVGKFMDGKKKKPRAVIRGVWWFNDYKDNAMAKVAKEYDIPFVKTHDLFKTPGMDAKQSGYKHPGIQGHPGDKGMQAIADRLLKPLFEKK